MKSDLLIIIPAYNEEENIEKVVENLRINYGQYDYIVVNDGSRDSTAQICREKGFHLLDLPVNLGLAGAFQTGMKYAYEKGYAYAIQFDADGQHLPEYLDAMLERIRQGYDIVIGSRFVRFKKSRSMRMIGSRMITVAIKMTTDRRPDFRNADVLPGYDQRVCDESELRTGTGYGFLSYQERGKGF